MEAQEEEMKSKCSYICHTNLLDYVLLIGGSSPNRVRSLANHTYGLYLRNMLCSSSSAVGIKADLSSREKINQLWLGITCFECVRIRDTLRHVVYSLVAQLDGPTWAAVMLRKLPKSNQMYCRLFLARIFADDWKKRLVFATNSPCYPEYHQDETVTLDSDNGTCKRNCDNVPMKTGKALTPLKRKRGKEEKKVSMEEIYSYLSRNVTVKEAAEGLRVSKSTLKRKCRQLGISQWPTSKGKRRCQRTSQEEKVPGFSPGLEVISLKSVSSAQAVVSQYMGCYGTPNCKKVPRLPFANEPASLETVSSEKDLSCHYRSRSSTPKGTNVAESGSGLKAVSQNSTSSTKEFRQYFSNITHEDKNVAEFGSSTRSVSQCREIDRNLRDQRSLLLLPYKSWEENQPKSFSHAWNRTTAVHLGTNLSTDTMMHGRLAYSNEKNSVNSFSLGETSGVLSPLIQQDCTIEGMTWLIKATYKDDMVRFHYIFKPNIAELKKEVARRLNLKLGTFKVKYLDDEDEWTLLASDLDWQEFMYISRSSSRIVVRLLIQDWRMEEEDKDDLQATLLKL